MSKPAPGTTPKPLHKPILIVPNDDIVHGRTLEPYSSIFANAAPTAIVANHPQASPGGITLRQGQWAWLATQHPDLFKDFMQFPQDPRVLAEIARLAKSGALNAPLQQGLPLEPPPLDGYQDITAVPSSLVGAFFSMTRGLGNAHLHVVFQPESGRYRVEWHRVSRDPAADVAERMFSAAWRFSSMSSALMRFVITDREVTDTVSKGARVMLIPNEAAIESPLLAALSEGGDGIPQFWFPGEDGVPHGSSVSLVLPFARERFRAGDLLDRLEREALEAVQRGFEPALALDLDGTLFDARDFTARLFRAWAESYDGPDAAAVRALVATAGRLDGWNGRDILEKLGVTREETLVSAKAYHDKHFFDPQRRVSVAIIPGIVDFVRLLQARLAVRNVMLGSVFVTLRSADDDNLPGGISSSEIALRKAGIWNDASIMVRHEGPPIDWSTAAYKSGKNEPEKWEMVKKFRAEHRKVWFIGLADNAPAHINGYKKFFGHNIDSIHVQGDLPPHSPPLPPGVYTVDPKQAEREIQELGGVPEPDLGRLPAPLSGPAFAPLVEKLRAARVEGKRPVAVFDIDDTVLASSKRAKKILQNFLADWVPAHPGKEWAVELARHFTPSRVEYGPRAMIGQAGLETLGIEQEFERYFAQHFLSIENGDHPGARQEAAALVAQLQALGVRIVYLNGRMQEGVGAGTKDNLLAVGLPVDEPGVDLLTRRDGAETDEAFKARAFAGLLSRNETLVGVFDNEPDALLQARRVFPEAPLFLVGDRRSADSPDLPGNVVTIMNFTGAVGRLQPRMRPPEGAQLRANGESLAAGVLGFLADIWDALTSLAGSPAEQQQRIDRAAREAAAILGRIANTDPQHPEHAAFLGAISGAFAGRPEGLERRFEDLVDIVSGRVRRSFVSLRGPNGELRQIIEAKNGSLNPLKTIILPETTITAEPLAVAPGIAGMDLQAVLPSIAKGPKLHLLTESERYHALLFGGLTETFPRMDVALSWLVGSLMAQTGKKAQDLSVLEYGPRLAFAPMLALARMGVNVGWWDAVESKRLQTEQAIRQLPKEVRAKISMAHPSRKERPDAVIGNMLPRNVSFKDFAKGSFSGVIVLQSEKDAESIAKELPEGTPWECVSEVPLGANDYVLPSAFLSEGQISPVTFQVWKMR